MCLTIPKQVISVKKDGVTVRLSNGVQKVGAIVDVKKGDWVLTQNNIIVKKISQKQAEEINNLLRNTK